MKFRLPSLTASDDDDDEMESPTLLIFPHLPHLSHPSHLSHTNEQRKQHCSIYRAMARQRVTATTMDGFIWMSPFPLPHI